MEKVTEDLDNLQLDSIEDISTEFNKTQAFVLGFEETCGDQSLCTFEDAIKKLQAVQRGIINQSIFSPNEDFEEIQTENLKYLLLPYYMGDVFGRMTEFRKKNLEFSKIYLTEFLKLVDHYGLVSEKTRDTWKNLQENDKFEPSREDKISQFREQKELENKIKNLEKIKDEDVQRDAVKTQCQIYIFKAIDTLRSMVMEFEILAYKEKIENDEQAKKEHQDSLQRPLPKLKYWQVPKQEKKDKQDLPYLLSQAEEQALCHSCAGKTYEELKQMKKQEVWRPGESQATVRLEELADMYMADMAKMEEQKKQAEEEAELRKQNVDSDHEDEVEIKRIQDSNWDNWKDANEKGAGNRMGK